MERYKVGQYVFTTKDKGSKDWDDNDRARRRPWGVFGKIKKVHDSHGLCYAVMLDSPFSCVEYFEHEELEAAG